jgi:hypothetical protein
MTFYRISYKQGPYMTKTVDEFLVRYRCDSRKKEAFVQVNESGVDEKVRYIVATERIGPLHGHIMDPSSPQTLVEAIVDPTTRAELEAKIRDEYKLDCPIFFAQYS